MDKRRDFKCADEQDLLHHLMEQQIAYICVDEEEERMREEAEKNKLNDY